MKKNWNQSMNPDMFHSPRQHPEIQQPEYAPSIEKEILKKCVVEFGCAVTAACSESSWVARKGGESIFGAFTQIAPQVIAFAPSPLLHGTI